MPLVNRFREIRRQTENLCKPLKIEDYVPQPVAYVSPPKWHLAHTTWFFEEMVLAKQRPNYQRFHPDFAFLFNSYYNTIGKRTLRTERGNMTRPTVDEIYAYRRFVDEAIEKFLSDSTPSLEIVHLIELGLNHEQQHQELLITDLKYILGHNPTFPVYREDTNLVAQKNKLNGWLNIPEGIYEIGCKDEEGCFDNEKNAHKVYLQPFSISKAIVTNGEYLDFIADGGYQKFSLWLDEGWTWLQDNNISTPMYWHFIDGEWYNYTLAGLKPIDKTAMLAHVSFYEASAFATWKGMRLPTEFEWEAASAQLSWSQRWEWTNSAYLPYPGFKIAEGAVGEYNGKFMINQMVLRGASTATAAGHSRKTYRNFFHPQYQWQFAGIRLAR